MILRLAIRYLLVTLVLVLSIPPEREFELRVYTPVHPL